MSHLQETSHEACDSSLFSEELLFHLHAFTTPKFPSEDGTGG